jgi:polyphosphate kinase 2 (PPK2 family)
MVDKRAAKLPRKVHDSELLCLQAELVKLQEWVRAKGARLVVVFEGRDAAGAKDAMMAHTDIVEAPWYVVDSDDKRRARLNMIAHLLSTLPYHEVPPAVLELPQRPPSTGYQRPPRDLQTYVPDHSASL